MEMNKYLIQEKCDPYTGVVELSLHSSSLGVVLTRKEDSLESHKTFRQLVLLTIGVTENNYISITDESKRCDVRIDEGVVYVFPKDQYIDSKETERLGYIWGIEHLDNQIGSTLIPKLPKGTPILGGAPLYYYNGDFQIRYNKEMKGYVLERMGVKPVVALYYQSEDTELQYMTFKKMCKKHLEKLENACFNIKEV